MKQRVILFIGRTGVGKSSIINLICGKQVCDTDPYRPCTKKASEVGINIDNRTYKLVDTPGLCEGDEDLDNQYLEIVGRYLDQNPLFNFVFKSDDKRLRTEDHRLLRAVVKRFGNDALSNAALLLTFAGNLGDDFVDIAHKRTRLITNAIYCAQESLGQPVFSGFAEIVLMDGTLGRIYEIDSPDNVIPGIEVNTALSTDNYEGIARKLGINERTCQSVVMQIMGSMLAFGEGYTVLARRLNMFPFHNILESPRTNYTLFSCLAKDRRALTAVEEIAALLESDGIKRESMTIAEGMLYVEQVVPWYDERMFTGDEEEASYYGDLEKYILTKGIARSVLRGSGIIYNVEYKLVCRRSSIDEFFESESGENIELFIPPIIRLRAKNYREFILLLRQERRLLRNGFEAMRAAMTKGIADSG